MHFKLQPRRQDLTFSGRKEADGRSFWFWEEADSRTSYRSRVGPASTRTCILCRTVLVLLVFHYGCRPVSPLIKYNVKYVMCPVPRLEV